MSDPFIDVFEFHKKFGCFVGNAPAIPNVGTVALREALLREEFRETIAALHAGDIPLMYVAIGLAISYGIYLPPIWEEVHAANMRKTGGDKRDDGKVMKPAGWKGPEIGRVLREQGWEDGK
jgi:predicted HAD superfamily Cof-like phosphohydrolase